MVPKSKLTDEQAANLAVLSRRFPKTGKACQIVASLDDFDRSATPKEADGAFKRQMPVLLGRKVGFPLTLE